MALSTSLIQIKNLVFLRSDVQIQTKKSDKLVATPLEPYLPNSPRWPSSLIKDLLF